MGVTIFCDGLIEGIELDEPFQATMQNMSAAITTNMLFFVGKRRDDGHPDAIKIDRVIHIVDNGYGDD